MFKRVKYRVAGVSTTAVFEHVKSCRRHVDDGSADAAGSFTTKILHTFSDVSFEAV